MGFMFGAGGGSVKMPSVASASTQKSATAKPANQETEQEKINKRLVASSLTKDWGKLTLGKPALLGVLGL